MVTKTKRKIQICVDVLMTCVLLLLMSYSIAGELLHEILGITLFALFIVHHVLSASFTKALFKGKRSADKTAKIMVDLLLTVVVLAQLLSAVPLSKYLFTFLGIASLSSVSRTVHLLGGYWGFALMSLHIGFHLDFMLAKPMRDKKKRAGIITVMALLFAAGLVMFIREGIYQYMLLLSQFVYFDAAGGLPLFLVKYILILCMFAVIGYAVMALCKNKKRR